MSKITAHLNEIVSWQLATGNSGAPHKAIDARLAKWARFAARQAASDPALAAEVRSLGIPVHLPMRPRTRDLANAKRPVPFRRADHSAAACQQAKFVLPRGAHLLKLGTSSTLST